MGGFARKLQKTVGLPLLNGAQKPTYANTGVPSGETLTNSGAVTVSTAGATLSNKNVTGYLRVNANNVTVENCRINVTDYYGLRVQAGVTGVTVRNCEFYTDAGGFIGISGGGMLIENCYISGFENGITLVDGNTIVRHNCIEKLLGNSAGAHYDGIELYSGSNYQVTGNNIRMTDTSGAWRGDTGAINVTPTWSNIDNVLIDRNWLGGGSLTLNLDEQGGYVLSNLTVTNNRFYGSAPNGYAVYGPVRAPNLITVKSGNVWDDTNQLITNLN